MKAFYLLVILCSMGLGLCAQPRETLNLQQCIDISLKNNLTILQQQVQVNYAKVDEFAAKFNYYAPSLTGTWNLSRSYGAVFDQVRFQRIQKATDLSSPGVTLNYTVFQGLARYYTLQQTKSALLAQQTGLQRVMNTVLTSVINGYLAILVDESNISISRQRIEVLKKQEERTSRLFEAGSGTEYDVLNVRSQLAVEELNLITTNNQLQTDRITLLQLLQLNPTGPTEEGYQFAPLDTSLLHIDLNQDVLPPVVEVEENALEHLPDLQEQRYRLAAFQYAQKAAYGRLLPTLTFSGGYQSSYSSNGGIVQKNTSNTPLGYQQIKTYSDSLGTTPLTTLYQPLYNSSTSLTRFNYWNQLSDNKNQFLQATVNIPILNGWTTRRLYQRSKIDYQNTTLDYEVARNRIINNVRQAHLDAIASRSRVESLDLQSKALREAYNISEAQYNAGLVNFYTYIDALNNYSKVQAQQIQSLYDYYLRKKILDFYQGKNITFQ